MTCGPSAERPSVSVIIPHLNQRARLEACLDSIRRTTYPHFSVCVVDNGAEASDIGDIGLARPDVHVLRLPCNKGYAGGCNAGLRHTSSKYVLFLNDDTLVEPGWLDALVETAEHDGTVGALQPKILSLRAYRRGTRRFDHAGAAGGLIDRLGFPYCYGRVFSGTEVDRGQYDRHSAIFWASGTAMFAVREVVEKLGGFDEDFFMHMEEIDLCWRMQLQGYRICSVPEAVVYHEGGASLSEGSVRKIFFNHRNNVAMMLKNCGLTTLLLVLPARMLLEVAAACFYLFSAESGVAKAFSVIRAAGDNLLRLGSTMRKRRQVQQSRTVSDRDLFRSSPLFILSVRKGGPPQLT
jgi:GT2 family glycosyltransferase